MRRLRWVSLAVAAIACGLILSITVAAGERPLAVSPGSGVGTVVSDACPTFSWGVVPGATSYELVTYKVLGGSSANASPGDLTQLWRVALPGSARAWTVPTAKCLAHGGTYAWAVRAVINGQPGAWSEANLFTIEKAPSAEEVREMMDQLRRYLSEGGQQPPKAHSAGGEQGAGAGMVRPLAAAGAFAQLRKRSAAEAASGLKKVGSKLSFVSRKSSTPTLGTPSLSIDGNLSLGSSSNVFKNGSAFLWNDTTGNLALGDSALSSVSGYAKYNTAIGAGALSSTYGSITPSAQGSANTAIGAGALSENTVGEGNTASGYMALNSNTSGIFNTAVGYKALYSEVDSDSNTAIGYKALFQTTGFQNTATGSRALFSNTSGLRNVAAGLGALYANTSGSDNTAIGKGALSSSTKGTGNIAIGYRAGINAGYSGNTTSYNIFIGNEGGNTDSGVIRIGNPAKQFKTFVVGIYNVTTDSSTASSVVVSDGGQLGTVASSRRFKQDIEDMGDVTEKLYELRPVTFRYKKHVKEAIAKGKDPKTIPRSYGLIAEDVAKVFPDLVIYDKDGKPQTVLYRFLAPMLLNELEKEHWTVIEQSSELAREKAKDDAQETELRSEANELATLKERDALRERELAAVKSELSRLETRLAAKGNPGTRSGDGAAAASKLQR